jgi:hypothetical protein
MKTACVLPDPRTSEAWHSSFNVCSIVSAIEDDSIQTKGLVTV